MALRMNIYGCNIQAIKDILGSKNTVILDAVIKNLVDVFHNKDDHHKALAWLNTLINDGFTLKSERESPTVQSDGGLLIHLLETEVHITVINRIMHVLRDDRSIDLTTHSSHYHYSAMTELYRELRLCGFTSSRECPKYFYKLMFALLHGSPLFGDNFHSDWSFYAFLTNQELSQLTSVLNKAKQFERSISKELPEEIRVARKTCLSNMGISFVNDLIEWFSQIHKAGQDAYLLWY